MSREKILNTALRLFAEVGYDRTSVRMIAREAGISQGLMYNYFEGKEGLLSAIFERSMADVRRSFAMAGGDSRPEEGLERLIYSSLAVVEQNMEFWKLSYSLRMQPAVLKSLGDFVPTSSRAIRGEIEAYFSAMGRAKPAVEAALLFALIDGIAQHYVLEPDYPLKSVLEAVVAHFVTPGQKEADDESIPKDK